MAGSRAFCTLLLALKCLVIVVSAQTVQKSFLAKDVPGAVINGNGQYEIEHNGMKFLVIDEEKHKMPFFFNPQTQEASWADPRIEAKVSEPEPEKPKAKSATLFVVTLLPFLAFAVFVVGRVVYLQKFYPELLWPTKERKYRYRSNSKFKPQKARGKMSQDGKGGRSANS